MNKCINCTYLCSCNQASEEIIECDRFKRIGYEVKLERKKDESKNSKCG